MGWEWHNRRRDSYGRFSADRRGRFRGNTAQIHIRWKPEQADFVRAKARENCMEIGEYIWGVLYSFYKPDDPVTDRLDIH